MTTNSASNILRRLENKVDELTRENKDLKTQCAAMKDALDEIMEMTRSDLRNHLERWQAVYRTREYRMIKKSSAKKPEMDKDKKVIDLKELTPIPKSQVPKSILSAATTLCEDLPKPFSSKVNQSP
uniref:Uncharacterized protein n=1 Tax=Phlebotomus papatasi TaxID=29031 RepID=A0A1B0DFU9_PHLPP